MDRSLLKDHTLKLNSKLYVIEKCIGQGAHCLVYDALSESDNRKVRIKECFPMGHVIRKGSMVQWCNPKLREKDFQEFRDAYHKMVSIQNNPMLTNSVTKIADGICEENGTLYFVVAIDNGKTFDNDDNENLEEIVETIIALSKVIKIFHDNGYLYLDIKPENFMIMPETREMIKILDTDSIILEKDLQEGKIRSLSYSEGWSSPEQLRGNYKKVSVKSDIYAIGAILFYKVMGRCPDNEDIGIYPEWIIPQMIVEQYFPEIKDRLEIIFKKTISVTTGRRFNSVDELIQNLENLFENNSNKTRIVSNILISNSYFAGREKELKDLHNLLLSDVRAVFIHGFGGIGKTELVMRYVQEYKEYYNVIYFPQYDEKQGLQEYIRQISIVDKNGNLKTIGSDCENPENEKLNQLKTLVSSKTLFVIDNYDSDDDYLNTLLQLDAKFIFTSRINHSDIVSDQIKQYELGSIGNKDLISVFEKYHNAKYLPEEQKVLEEIISLFDGFTIAIPLIAKWLKRNDASPKDFLDQYSKEGLSGFEEDSDKITHTKDLVMSQASLNGHLKKLLRLSGLNFGEKKVLVNLSALSCMNYLTKETYKKYTGTKSVALLNDMINDCLVKEEYQVFGQSTKNTYISLHPIINELVKEELTDEKYYEDIFKITHKTFRSLAENPNDKNILDTSKIVLGIYHNIKNLDPNLTQIYKNLQIFVTKEFQKRNLKIINSLFRGSRDICRTYIGIDKYMNALEKQAIQSEQGKKDRNEWNSYILDLLSVQVMKVCYRPNILSWDHWYDESIYIKNLTSNIEKHIKNIGNLLSNNQEELVDKDCLDAYRLYADMIFDILYKEYYGGRLYVSSYTDHCVSRYEYPYFDIYLISQATLYFSLAKYVSIISRLYKKSKREKYYKRLVNKMISELCYYNGELMDSPSFKVENPDLYTKKWWKKYEITDPNNPYFEGPLLIDGISLLYVSDRKAWNTKFGESWKSMIAASQNPYKLYDKFLEFDYPIEHRKILQNGLLKGDLAGMIISDADLTDLEKKKLLVEKVYEQVFKIKSLENDYKNNKAKFNNEFSTMFNIYLNCLHKCDNFVKNEVGKPIDRFRYKYYKSLFYLCRIKHIKNHKTIDIFKKEILSCDLRDASNKHYLLELINDIYSMGMHNTAIELKKEVYTKQ